MPHGGRRPAPAPFRPAQFINPELSDEDRLRVKATELSIELLDTSLISATSEGYKLSLKFDERNDCYAAWLIAPDKSPNKGFILAGRGSTPLKAVRQLFYAHIVMFEKRWADHSAKPGEEIDD